MSSLPGGIFIDSCIITLPKDSPYKIPVVVRNETDRDICLPVRCVLAELSAVEIISSQTTASCHQQFTVHTDQQAFLTESSLKFDFGDSLPEKWKSHMTEKLNTYSDVFSHHDLDYGHATKLKHFIKLKDETPFKHRPRPIHPQDYDAVRRHLQDFLRPV